MLALIVIAAIVVVVAVVFLAMGRGGGMSAERNDYLALDVGPVSATDVVLLRPPTGVWGYNMQATDEALEQIAESIRERDVRIVALEQLVTDLSRRDHDPQPVLGSPYSGARHRRASAAGGIPAEEVQVQAPWALDLPEPARQAGVPETAPSPVADLTAETAESAWLPVEPPQPSGDDAPPEESHD